MGGPLKRNRRRQGVGLCRHDRRTGPPSGPGPPQPDRQSARADLSVCTGAELEIGWLPAIIQQTNNKIRPGAPGAFEAPVSSTFWRCPAPRPRGGRHPRRRQSAYPDQSEQYPPVAKALADRFAQLDPANAQTYAARLADFTTRWQAAMAKWQMQAAPLKGAPIAVEHQSWIYLENWLGLTSGRPGTQARRAAVRRLSRRSGGDAAKDAGQDGDPRRL